MTRVLVVLAAALLGSCQTSPLSRLGPPPPVSGDVLGRFELGPPDPASTLEPVHVLGDSPDADREGIDAPSASIELADVLASVERHFPLVLAAREEIEIAEGNLQQARGGFDTLLAGRGRSEVQGFYENDRFDVFLQQPTALWGATFSGGYRLGRGDFATYDGKAKTDEGGEVRLGVSLPLLQGREIDPRRVALWSARIERRKADPLVRRKLLETTLEAADAYWKWVAAGRRREVATRLLALAEDRAEQVRLAVEEGLLAPILLVENERLIVDRRSSLVSAERSLQEAAILLSLYWRDAVGRPSLPKDDALPYDFPAPRDPEDVLLPGDEAFALEQRPEPQAVELELEQLRLGRQLGRNRLLPDLDVAVIASQDVGETVNDPDDKGDLELEAFVTLGVPLQRREARGKLREIDARTARLEHQARFLRESIVNEVRDARSALTQSWLRIREARENVRLANELADAERFMLLQGESDLLRVNLREQQAAGSAAALIDVLRDYFGSLAAYRAVLGVQGRSGDTTSEP